MNFAAAPRAGSGQSPLGRGWALPLAAAGLLGIVLPARIMRVVDDVHAMQTASMPAALTAPLLPAPPVAAPGVAPGTASPAPEVVSLRDGVTLHPVVSVTLSGTAPPAPVGDDQPADGRLLAEVARRQAALDRREHDLETRSTQVAAAETEAKQEIAELAKMRTEIEKLVVHESTAADADIDLLVGLYQNMKPAQAAAVLGKLEPQKAALVLQKLGDRAGGPILAAMDPTAALAITEEVAQRRAAFRR